MTDRQRDLKVELTLVTIASVPRSPSMLHTGESGIPYNSLYRKTPHEKGSFFRLQVYKRDGISIVVKG